MAVDSAAGRLVYVGTYTAPDTAPGGRAPSTAEGIYVFRRDLQSGGLEPLQVAPISNPSFLAMGRGGAHLYCVQEDEDGRVSAFAIDRASGALALRNSVSSAGSLPTHLSVHPSGRYVVAANYGSGSCVVIRIEADGSLGERTGFFQGEGNGAGPHPERQAGPHAHQIVADPSGERLFGVDLGADKINVLRFDPASGALTRNVVPCAPIDSGSGPRHLCFHPSASRAYVLNELGSSVSVFEYDAARGALRWSQTLSTLPSRFSRHNVTSEIRIHPDGRYLYATNRGHDSVAMFAIDADTGSLSLLGWQSSLGEWPRGMNIDPSGTFLYVANQNSDTIVAFRIDRETGALREAATRETPTPVDIVFS